MVSLSPLIYYNVTHNFANIKHFMAGNAVHRFACDYNLLPGTMQYGDRTINPCKIFEDNVEFASGHFLSLGSFLSNTLLGIFGNWIYYLVTLFLMGVILYHNRKSALPVIKSLIPLQKNNLKLKEHNKELFIIGFFLFWVLVYVLSGRGGTKHFFPVFPFIIILISISLSRIKVGRIKKFNVNLQLILLILLVTSALIPNVKALFKPDIEDISKTIDFLKDNDIKYVYTDHPRKWKILFYTQEEIIASCNICQCVNQYPRVEHMMKNQANTGYVFYVNSNIARNLISFLEVNGISYNTHEVDNNIIVYNLSETIDPVEVLTPCNWLREQG